MDLIHTPRDRQYQNATLFGSSEGFVELDPSDLCHIDEETVKTLELVQNNVDSSNRRHTLFGYLNTHSSTTTGARLLKQAILSPLCNPDLIDHRLNCVEYLVGRVDSLATITNNIKKFGQNVDLDSVIPSLVNLFKSRHQTLGMIEKKLDALTTLERLVSQVSQLVGSLAMADQPTLNIYKVALEDPAYDEILRDITTVIESDIRINKGKRFKVFCIKEGIENLFDIARTTFQDAINNLEQVVQDLQRRDRLPWKLAYNETRGYHLTIATSQVPKDFVLSSEYIQVNKNRSMISCTTGEIMKMNVRATVSYENSMKLANEVLASCLTAVMNNISAIYKLVDVIGTLDLITCFAKLVSNSNGRLVRPKLTATDTLINGSRHPVLETVLNVNNISVMPNDIMLTTSSQNFILVTGPNMGGKSIYLKQVGIIQVMAQIGCYVPAEKAYMKVMRRIVARSGTSDDNQSSCSSFMYEMKGIATALKTADGSVENSVLYLIDEVGRGTSIDDGASYSFAIAEELALRRMCFTVFATHFDQVFSMVKIYRNVAAYHFKYDEDDSECGTKGIKISHKLVPGIAVNSHYGVKLAEACGLPEEITRAARIDVSTHY